MSLSQAYIMKIKSIIVRVVTSVLIILIAIACDEDQTEVPKEIFFEIQGENGFVGMVDGTNAFVSILLGEEEGIAYVCNGEEDISEWLSGTVTSLEDISFTNANGAKITANFTNSTFIGEIKLSDGREFQFEAMVNNNTYGGIYRVLGEEAVQAEIKAGWIVKSETDQRGFFSFKSVTQPTTTLSKSKLKDISDGTSNTLVMAERSVSFFRYKVKKPSGPAPPIPIPYPNLPSK